MDKMRFVKAVYKAATPSVNYDEVEIIIAREHTIPKNVYEGILLAMGVEEWSDEMISCNRFMLDIGPKIID